MANKNYDSDFCGSLPIHQVNMIQPYGVLFVVNYDYSVIQTSENCIDLIGTSATDTINQPLSKFLKKEELSLLSKLLETETSGKLPYSFTLDRNGVEETFFALIHKKERYFIIEAEQPRYKQADSPFSVVFQRVKHIMAEITAAKELSEVCTIAAKKLKELSGFHRVLAYQFDENWNGMVVAEEKEADQEPYLGLHFPASDIPKQARALYLKNPYRQIPNRQYEPVKLYPVINPLTFGFTDLSDCNLRGVVTVHLEYMENMGICSSLSLAIIHDQKLWGLISFHHKEEKFVSYEMCSVFEMISGSISERISSIQSAEQYTGTARLKSIHQDLIEQLYTSDNIPDALFGGELTICDLLKCNGVAYVSNNKVYTSGDTPNDNQILDLVFWLIGKEVTTIYSTHHLVDEYDHAEAFADTASGLIALSLLPDRNEFLIGFRQEVIKEVSWGGNPNDAIQFEQDGKNYHPRNSFAIWKDKQRGNAAPWKQYELDAATSFRNFLIDFLLKKQNHKQV